MISKEKKSGDINKAFLVSNCSRSVTKTKNKTKTKIKFQVLQLGIYNVNDIMCHMGELKDQ